MPPKKTAAKKAVAKKVSGSDAPTSTAGGAGACNGSAASCANCGICEQPIIDGKDQTLFCEGIYMQAVDPSFLRWGSTVLVCNRGFVVYPLSMLLLLPRQVC